MSIIISNNQSRIFPPKDNYKIAKYLDLSKYVSLLQRQALFYCRVDKLEDKFEGTTSKANYDYRKDAYGDSADVLYEHEKKQKSLYCINCWNKYVTESAALWKIYSGFNQGIMIKSSIKNLIRSHENITEEISLSEIKYIDYENDLMNDGNTIFPIIHKHIAYSYENEIRLIHKVQHSSEWKHDWENEEVEEGVFINLDLETLIDEIIISPFSPKWYIKMITGLTQKYGLDKEIINSCLSINE